MKKIQICDSIMGSGKTSAGEQYAAVLAANGRLAEGVGFEPTEHKPSGFQDQLLKPLGQPSI